jgi:hypothetical protein
VSRAKPNEWIEYGFTEEEWKSFHKSKRWRIRNPGAQAIATANWVRNNPEQRRISSRRCQLKMQYGITPEQYDEMLIAQDGKCEICKTDKPTGKWKVFAVDHCHKTGNIRGLLCNECNRGMGLLRDDPELLIKAAEYLNKNIKESKNG